MKKTDRNAFGEDTYGGMLRKRMVSALLCALLLLALVSGLPQSASAASLTQFNIRLDEPVASFGPDFSPEFNTDIQLYSSVTWQENSPGFSQKLTGSDEFRAGLAYQAVIWVKFSDGNYLATDIYGDLAATITVNGKAISSLKINGRNAQGQINEVTITCQYDPLSGMEISKAQVTGIPTPVEGQMPVYSFTPGSNSAYFFYHTQPIVWWDKTAGRAMDSGDTFIAGHVYQVEIWLAANREQGYTFRLDSYGKPNVNVTLNSRAADSVITAYEQDPREVITAYYTFSACQAAHTHTPSAWRITGAYHYTACTTCGDFLEQEDHTGGRATCAEKGKCTVCGYEYLEVTEEHTPDTSKWVARLDMYHFHACKLCGAHCDIQDHVPGPAATDTTPRTCVDCGYILEPARGHVHQLTKVEELPAQCEQPGVMAHYECSGCSDWFKDAQGKEKFADREAAGIPGLEHVPAQGYAHNGEYHWRTCAVCGEQLANTQAEHEPAQGVCTVCGFGGEEETTGPTEPGEQSPITAPRQQKQKDLTWLWATVAVAAGALVGVLAVMLKKKR